MNTLEIALVFSVFVNIVSVIGLAMSIDSTNRRIDVSNIKTDIMSNRIDACNITTDLLSKRLDIMSNRIDLKR